MSNQNDIALQSSLKFGISKNKDTILNAFVESKYEQSFFIITRLNDHVFIRIFNLTNRFWSPQLQIEITEVEKNSSIVNGMVSPNPTAWTLFTFLHFMIAGLVIAFGIWTYSNMTLNMGYILPVSFMVLMVIIWILLYAIGRIGKESSKVEINDLYTFMQNTIKNKLQTETNSEFIKT